MNKTRRTTVKARRPSHALVKGLTILEAFGDYRPEWGVRELARVVNINPTSVYRLAATLSDMGYLKQDPKSRRYSLGPRVMKLAALYAHQNPLPGIALKVFQEYGSRFEHAMYLIALADRFEAVYVVVMEGRAPIRVAVEPGGMTALHSTAAGKVLLSFQGDEYLEAFIKSSKLTRFTPRTITSPSKLRAEVLRTREQGFALNDGEQFEDIGAVAVPLYDMQGRVLYTVSLSFPRHLKNEGRLQLEPVIQYAREMAEKIEMQTYGTGPMGANSLQ